MRLRLGRVLALCLAAGLAAAGCTKAEADFTPTLTWGECPDDVEVTFLSRHECGRLTVLADRSDPDGPTLSLLVSRVWPVGAEPKPGFGTSFGRDVADAEMPTGDMAAGATRLGRTMVQIEWRGSGPHNEPSLRCPEVDALQPDFAAATSEDRNVREAFVGAVKACADRLRKAGVDPAEFDVAETAADIEDLRRAVGVERWRLAGTYGTASRYLFEYVSSFPGRLERAYLDSPWPPGLDDVTGGVLGTRAALAELFHSCAASTRCSSTYPDLERTWERALDRLTLEPLSSQHHIRGVAGGAVDVTVDDAKLLRAARFALGGDGPANLEQLPAVITAAAHGRLHPLLGDIVATDPGWCYGYVPLCSGQRDFALGVYLTVFCRDQLPLLDRARLDAAIDGDPVYESVFGRSPFLDACGAWNVPPSDAQAPTGLNGTPALLLPGQFNSFSPAGIVRDWADGLGGDVTTLVVPGATHNTLGSQECAITARTEWTEDPSYRVPVDACADAPPVRWAPPS
jgi:hypothetical protein